MAHLGGTRHRRTLTETLHIRLVFEGINNPTMSANPISDCEERPVSSFFELAYQIPAQTGELNYLFHTSADLMNGFTVR